MYFLQLTNVLEIESKYLVMGDSKDFPEISVRKKLAGPEKILQIYISPGGEELINVIPETKEQYKITSAPESLKPESWQMAYITGSLKRVETDFGVELKTVNTQKEADFTIAICPIPENDHVTFAYDLKPEGWNSLYISHQTGLEYPNNSEINLNLVEHDDSSKKTQKQIFLHELGHLLGLEHPIDAFDGDQIPTTKYFPPGFDYQTGTSNGYECSAMGWCADDPALKNDSEIWFSNSDINALNSIWEQEIHTELDSNNYDEIIGNSKNDKLKGKKTAVHLKGMGGNDKLIGSRKDDILDGGEGDDVLTGKKGADTYVLSSGKDKFNRFNLKEGDTIEIDSDIAYTLVQSKKNTLIQHDDGVTSVLKVNKDKLADVIDMI
jgi:hypothetical protein